MILQEASNQMLQNYGPSSPENCKFIAEAQVDLEPEPVPKPIDPPVQGELFKSLLKKNIIDEGLFKCQFSIGVIKLTK